MTLGQLACKIGLHLIDQADHERRRARAARMGVNVRHYPAQCERCGRWVRS